MRAPTWQVLEGRSRILFICLLGFLDWRWEEARVKVEEKLKSAPQALEIQQKTASIFFFFKKDYIFIGLRIGAFLNPLKLQF